MPEDPKPNPLAAAWKSQPEEERPVTIDHLLDRRTHSLYATTRSEIFTAIGAAVFFVAIMAWRFAAYQNGFPPLGFAAALLWVLISLFWFRSRLRSNPEPPKDALAATGLEHYRRELMQRRDHLRNPWIWHGPLLLACLTLATVLGGTRIFAYRSASSVLPLLILLAAWAAFGFIRRRQQAAALQQEIDELTTHE